MEKVMNRFNFLGQVQQDSNGEFVRFADVEEVRDSLIDFIANTFDAKTGKGLTKDETLKALGVFFRLTLAE
jgi:hypothetical protein